jgi:tight adherence protein B
MGTITWIIIGIVVVIVILLIVGVIVSSNSERSLVEQRLGQYLDGDGAAGKADKSAITDWVNTKVAKSSLGDRISRQLARADMKLKVAEYFALIIIAGIGMGVILWLLSGAKFDPRGGISFLGGLVVGGIIPPLYINSQQKRRLTRFNDQLADMLNLMVNGLRAGYSTMQAMEAISKELPAPISEEFRRVVQEMQLGVPMETALDNMYRRIPSDDLDFVITAVNVQREVGGNLSEILDTISFTIRERVRIKGEIRVMTSQVRTSGTALSLIPIFLTVFLWFLNPAYMNSFFNKGLGCGIAVLTCAGVLIIVGYVVMMRIAAIEV